MAQSSSFTLELLEKIGAPLAAAIESAQPKGDDPDIEAANVMAKMLGQSVQMSITLNATLNVTESEEQADATRLGLAALCAPLIAHFYTQNGRPPEDADIKRMIKAQEAVMAFADNFTPAADGKSRLSTLSHDAPLFDASQVSLVVMQVATPVVEAIAEFPFGQSENKLLQDVMTHLKGDAEKINGDANNKLGQILTLKVLAEIYAACHRAQTTKLASGNNEEGTREEISLAPVWAAYELRLGMVQAIAGMEVQAPAAPVAPPPMEVAPQAPAPLAVADAPPPPPQNAAPSSPMGFFKPNNNAQATAPAPAAAAPAPVEQPIAQAAPPPQAPVTPPAPETPSAPAATSPPSSPMGFFKPGAKKPADEGDGSAA